MDKPLLGTPPEPGASAPGPGQSRNLPRSADSAAPDTMANVRHAGLVMLIAFALMAVFNSSGLRSFARDLPGGWLADELVVRSDRWHELMVALGPAAARPAVTDLFERLRAIRWGNPPKDVESEGGREG